MRELSDQKFDAEMARRLKFSTLVTLRQQQVAKERLLCRAATQTMLPPLAPVERLSARDYALLLRFQVTRFLNVLVFDSSAYERANCPRRVYHFYTLSSRYSFTRLYA